MSLKHKSSFKNSKNSKDDDDEKGSTSVAMRVGRFSGNCEKKHREC